MENNESNRRIRYALLLDDPHTRRLIELGGGAATLEQARAWRAKEEDAEYEPCPDSALEALLSGLILDRRGPPAPSQPAAAGTSSGHSESSDAHKAATPVSRLSNNIILKQLRIALSLRTEEVHGLITAGGGKLGKTEVSAFFRNEQARNYRRCGDQVIRWFLAGLATGRNKDDV